MSHRDHDHHSRNAADERRLFNDLDARDRARCPVCHIKWRPDDPNDKDVHPVNDTCWRYRPEGIGDDLLPERIIGCEGGGEGEGEGGVVMPDPPSPPDPRRDPDQPMTDGRGAPLDRELSTYRDMLPRLWKLFPNRWVVIKGDSGARICQSYDDALRVGYEAYGLDGFLVKQILEHEEVVTGSIAWLAERDHYRVEAEKLRTDLDAASLELDRLKSAIREHRDQKGDDRCWIDDLVLYSCLNEEGDTPPGSITALPPRCDFLASCERFWKQRQCPIVKGTVHLPGDMTIAELSAEVERLRAENTRLTTERDVAQSRVAWLEGCIDGLRDDLSVSVREFRDSQKCLRAMEAERDAARTWAKSMTIERDGLLSQLAEMKEAAKGESVDARPIRDPASPGTPEGCEHLARLLAEAIAERDVAIIERDSAREQITSLKSTIEQQVCVINKQVDELDGLRGEVERRTIES